MNVANIPVPKAMQRFKTWHGYPIHYTVMVRADGTPDFKSMNEHRRKDCFKRNLCHLCGQRMNPAGPYYLIGGPMCVQHKRFIDGPMHKECAEYACKACPFLASPNGKYRAATPIADEQKDGTYTFTYDSVSNIRPARMALVECQQYRIERNTERNQYSDKGGPQAVNPFAVGQTVCIAIDILSVDWDIMPASKPDEELKGLKLFAEKISNHPKYRL